MIIGSVFATGQSRNSMFGDNDPAHRFNPTHANRMLRKAFREHGIEINTADVNAGKAIAFELHFEGRPLEHGEAPRFLVALENPYINTLNADPGYFRRFRRVFTWNPRFFGEPNVTPICYPNRLEHERWPRYAERNIFSCLVNANKQFPVVTPNDLYDERLAVIRWYERHAPDSFDLYGLGWGKPAREPGVRGRVKRRVQRLASQLFGYRPFPLWKGEIEDKASVLLRAKFAYCYENISDLSGYITEKIFDCLVCGCVPVYWGADDIAEAVPSECFVDRRRFRDTAEVHAHLLTVSAAEYDRYQASIDGFLRSEAAQRFSIERFVQVIVDGVQAELASGDLGDLQVQ